MEYDVSVAMALVDYLPVAFMGVAAVLLLKRLYGKMSVISFILFAVGEADIFMAGFLKATWKLLYGAGVCNFEVLNTMFLPTQSLGFLLAAIGILSFVIGSRKNKAATLLAAPPVFSGSMMFVMMMVLGLGGICTGLSILSARKKRGLAILFYVLCFVFSMAMGYLSSKDSTSATINWIEQTVNCLGQGCYLIGALILTKQDKQAA